jgi:hypothetical protein
MIRVYRIPFYTAKSSEKATPGGKISWAFLPISMQFRRVSIRRAIINLAVILVFGGILAYTAVWAQDDSKKAPTSSLNLRQRVRRIRRLEPVIRLETELVQIDLVVADKAGKLVSDLKREDFQVIEDGKPRP